MLTKTNLMRKKLFITIIALTGLYILTGCNGFDAAWYQQKSTKTSEPKVIDDNSVINIPNAANDPFLKPENNDANANGFSAKVFEKWLLTAKFSDKNVPSYTFKKAPVNNWNIIEATINKIAEFFYSGANSSAGSNSITDMKYFMYKGLNPLYSPKSNYNKDPHKSRLNRFYFYRFTGKGGGIASLNNYLVAVDSYTKLVFAFAIPTKTKNVLGNLMPTAWGPVDIHTIIDESNYKFYEFDPVGIVKSDGEVEVYQWFKDNMAKNNYHPIMGDINRPNATYGKAGKSPYINKGTKNAALLPRVDGKLTLKLLSLENVDFHDGGSKNAQFMYEFTSTLANGAVKNKKKDMLAKHKSATNNWHGLPNEAKELGVGSTLNFKDAEKVYFVSSQRKLFIDLDTDLREVDFGVGNLEKILSPSKPTLSFIYDRDKSAWILNKDIPLDFIKGTEIEFDKNFSLTKADATKNLVVTIRREKAGSDSQTQGTLKLTYQISWEELAAVTEVKGDLKVELVSLENLSFKDAWGDHGNADGTDMPEFLYKFTSVYSDGNAKNKHIHAKDTQSFSKRPSRYKHLKVGTTKFFNEASASHIFDISGKYNLKFKLATSLFEVDINSFTKLLEIGNSDIKFTYDRDKKLWQLAPDNKNMPNTQLIYAKDFSLSPGENAKDFIVKIKHKEDGELKLTYRLSWKEK